MNSPARPSLLAATLKHRGRILLQTAIITVALTAASFLLPNRFTASSVVLPPSGEADLLGLLSGVPGGVALSRAFGVENGTGADLYLGVLRSARLNQSLVERFELAGVYHQADREKAGRVLRSHTTLSLTNEGMVRVAVTERDRTLAANLANAYVEELDRFLRENTNTSARNRRAFLEKRIDETRRDLGVAEDALRDYQIQKKMPAAGVETDRSADAAADLMARRAAREVELGTLQSVSRTPSPRAEELHTEIAQIDVELVKIPPATTEIARLYRSVKMQEKVLLVLAEEAERARVLELRNMPTVEVLDRAEPPLHKSTPHRAFIAIAVLVIAFATTTALAWAREGALAETPRPA